MAYDLLRGKANSTDWSRGAESADNSGSMGGSETAKTSAVVVAAGLAAMGGWMWWLHHKRPVPFSSRHPMAQTHYMSRSHDGTVSVWRNR